MSAAEPPSSQEPPFLEDLRCSFCGKRGTEVKRLIAGPTPAIAICSECVELCGEILAEERRAEDAAAHSEGSPGSR